MILSTTAVIRSVYRAATTLGAKKRATLRRCSSWPGPSEIRIGWLRNTVRGMYSAVKPAWMVSLRASRTSLAAASDSMRHMVPRLVTRPWGWSPGFQALRTLSAGRPSMGQPVELVIGSSPGAERYGWPDRSRCGAACPDAVASAGPVRVHPSPPEARWRPGTRWSRHVPSVRPAGAHESNRRLTRVRGYRWRLLVGLATARHQLIRSRLLANTLRP